MYFSRFATVGLAGQVAIVVAALAALALAPPARGAVLLLPIGAEASAATLPAAIAAGAQLLAPGPIRGSLIVQGESAALSRAASGRPILVLAAPFVACGGAA